MSLLRAFLLSQGLAWGAWVPPKIESGIVASIFSDYNLCVRPIEELTVQPASMYVVAIMGEEYLTVSLASIYDLSTAPT